MKRLLLIIIASFIFNVAFSQKVSLSLTKFRTLFYNYDNIVDLAVSNYSCKETFLKSSNSKIKQLDSCSYIINPPTGSTHDTISIYRTTDRDTILVDTLIYSLKRIPMPTVNFEKKSYTGSTFLAIPNKLIASTKGLYIDIAFTVISYRASLMRGDSIIDSVSVDSNIVDDRLETIINKAILGDRVIIDEIHVQGEDGEIQEVESLFIKIR